MSIRNKVVGDLLNLFRDMIRIEQKAHHIKRQIPKPHLKKLFQKISKQHETISIQALADYVRQRIACNDRELYALFQLIDHHRCGFLLWQDFHNELTVVHAKTSSKIKKSKQITYSQVEKCFVSWLALQISGVQVMDLWRKELQAITPYILFDELNLSKTGVISSRELFTFFYLNQQQLNPQDCQVLYRCLLRRCHSEINLQVFCQNLKPLEFGYYEAYRFYLEQHRQEEYEIKEKIARQAVQAQEEYLRNRRNEEIVGLIHHEAGLKREQELENRFKDQIRAYQQLRFKTKKKFHPGLTFEQFRLMDKQNEALNLLKLQIQAEEAQVKKILYLEKLRNIDALRMVQNIKQHSQSQIINSGPLGRPRLSPTTDPLQLEKRIKSHAFSVLAANESLVRRSVHKDLQTLSQLR